MKNKMRKKFYTFCAFSMKRPITFFTINFMFYTIVGITIAFRIVFALQNTIGPNGLTALVFVFVHIYTLVAIVLGSLTANTLKRKYYQFKNVHKFFGEQPFEMILQNEKGQTIGKFHTEDIYVPCFPFSTKTITKIEQKEEK